MTNPETVSEAYSAQRESVLAMRTASINMKLRDEYPELQGLSMKLGQEKKIFADFLELVEALEMSDEDPQKRGRLNAISAPVIAEMMNLFYDDGVMNVFEEVGVDHKKLLQVQEFLFDLVQQKLASINGFPPPEGPDSIRVTTRPKGVSIQ